MNFVLNVGTKRPFPIFQISINIFRSSVAKPIYFHDSFYFVLLFKISINFVKPLARFDWFAHVITRLLSTQITMKQHHFQSYFLLNTTNCKQNKKVQNSLPILTLLIHLPFFLFQFYNFIKGHWECYSELSTRSENITLIVVKET